MKHNSLKVLCNLQKFLYSVVVYNLPSTGKLPGLIPGSDTNQDIHSYLLRWHIKNQQAAESSFFMYHLSDDIENPIK